MDIKDIMKKKETKIEYGHRCKGRAGGKRLAVLLLFVILTAGAMSSCGRGPIDESQLPDLETQQNQEEQTADIPAEQGNQNAENAQPEQANQSTQDQSQTGGANVDPGQVEPNISMEQAKKIALDRVPGAKEENITKLGLDFDDGRWIYEGEIIYNYIEYDFEIDAQTGNILEWELDD